MKPFEKIAVALVFILVGTGFYFSHTDLKWFEGVYVREDGPIEWLTVLALFLGCILSWYRASILRPFRSRTFTFSLFFLGALFLFGAGEEISWGQRIFGIKSPEFFMKNNSQMETNLHNLILGGVQINRLIFGLILGICVASYLLILPVLYNKFEKIKNLVNAFALPLPRLAHVVFYAILFIISEITPSGKKGELLEFGGCWIFLIMTFNPHNREVFSRVSFNR